MSTAPLPTPGYSVVILAGGRGTRLGQIDKSAIDLDGRSALHLALETIDATATVVVVGEPVSVPRQARFCLESPRFGGPVAAIAAGLDEVDTPIVCVLAVDMPWAGGLLPMLAQQCSRSTAEAVVPVDAGGRTQPLCAGYRTLALRRALASMHSVVGASMRELLALLDVEQFEVPEASVALLVDLDTPDDLERVRRDQAR